MEEPLQHYSEADDKLVREEDADTVRGVIASLSLDQQHIVVLFNEGFSAKEIAEALQMSTDKVYTYLRRALIKLRASTELRSIKGGRARRLRYFTNHPAKNNHI